jgi:DNA-binding transcriptional LysR family regulator
MTNIPTDLLRTLIAVVDLRSFTKAAAQLGVTQPAVSAQIKRLQILLGGELFDRTAHGIDLTPHGEMVVGYARRLLSINDQIVHLGGDSRPELAISIGTPSDFVASSLPSTLARLRARWPDVRFIVRTDFFDPLLRALRSGELDLLVGMSMHPPSDARHFWARRTVWVRSAATELDPNRPIPLVSHGVSSVYHRLATRRLKSAGLDWEDVFVGPSLASLSHAVMAGLGVMPITRDRAKDFGMTIWDDTPLPALPDLYTGVYVREGGARASYEQLADEIAATLRPKSATPPELVPVIDGARTADSAA